MDRHLDLGESTSVPPQPPVDPIDDPDVGAIHGREEFAGALRWFRRRQAARSGSKPLTYAMIAAKSGYSTATIHNYFQGKTLPQQREAVADILTVLGATPDDVAAMQQALDRVTEPPRTTSSAPQPRRIGVSTPLRRRWFMVCALAALVLATTGMILWQRQTTPDRSDAQLPTCADIGVFAQGIDGHRWKREVWIDAYEAAGGRDVLGCPVPNDQGFVHSWGPGMSQDLQDEHKKQTRLMALDRDRVIVMSGQYWTDYTYPHTVHAADLQGYPITDPVSCGNAEVVLLDKGDYTPGAMVTSPSGTYIWLPRPTWQEYKTMGGPQGPLGRPLNPLDKTIRGTIAFEHGSIDMVDNVTARVRTDASRPTTTAPCPS